MRNPHWKLGYQPSTNGAYLQKKSCSRDGEQICGQTEGFVAALLLDSSKHSAFLSFLAESLPFIL
jgi:hypothetical protein